MMASMQGIIVPRVLSTVVRCGVADSAGSLVPGGYSGVVMEKGTAVIISALTASRRSPRVIYMTTTTDCGNNESVVRGVVRDEAGYLALTITDSRVFRTYSGAERWLAVRGYNADGTRKS
jgi:hypothetical protein